MTQIKSGFLSASSAVNYSKGTHRKGAKLPDLHRHGEEFESTVRQIFEAAEMLDDRYVMAQKHRVRRTISIMRGIDVERIDPDQSGIVVRQVSCCGLGEVRMISARVLFRAPVLVPTCVDQHCFTL